MTLDENAWVWVAVLGPEGDERFLGRHDAEREEPFIPAFQTRETAKDWLEKTVREPGVEAEIQAIRYGDLCRQAEEQGFSVAMF